MTKRSFKAAKKAFHAKQASGNVKKKVTQEHSAPKQRKPRGMLGFIVDDEEEIKQQQQQDGDSTQTKRWFDDVPIFEKIDHSRLPVSQVEELYNTAVTEYKKRFEDFQISQSNSFEEEVTYDI
jgi:hypothetical protein